MDAFVYAILEQEWHERHPALVAAVANEAGQ